MSYEFESIDLTQKEYDIWKFIKQFIDQNNISPTVSEIAEAMKVQSSGTIYRYLQSLKNQGIIELVPNKKRNIRLVSQTQDQLYIVGRIAAGQPIEALEEKEPLDISHIFLGEGRYALKVVGDSMIEEGIFDGDIIVCQKAHRANNGEIAVCLIDHSWATLKKVYLQKEGGQMLLVPANVNHEPQIYDASRVTIQGLFVGLLRVSQR
jgi:repressor LexA